MRIGVPKEIKTHEYRVGLTPAAVREYVARGHEVIVETDDDNIPYAQFDTIVNEPATHIIEEKNQQWINIFKYFRPLVYNIFIERPLRWFCHATLSSLADQSHPLSSLVQLLPYKDGQLHYDNHGLSLTPWEALVQ